MRDEDGPDKDDPGELLSPEHAENSEDSVIPDEPAQAADPARAALLDKRWEELLGRLDQSSTELTTLAAAGHIESRRGQRRHDKMQRRKSQRHEETSASIDLESPQERSIPRPRRLRKTRVTGMTFVALLSVLALGTTGFAYVAYDQLHKTLNTTDVLDQPDTTDPAQNLAPPSDDGALDILLVGTDARTDMQGNPLPLKMLKELRTEDTAGINTDTIIVLRIPKNGAKPVGISIPRDTWVDSPRGGQTKINSVFGGAKLTAANQERASGERDSAKIERDSDQVGRKALVTTVQNLTQLRVDHYAEVNLLGFYLLTEALGGVEVCLNHPTQDKDSGANFKAGPQKISGGEALSFVRQRKNLPRGDLDRIVRQQVFLSSAIKQTLSAGTLTDPAKLGQLTDAIHKSMVLDSGLDLLSFARQASGVASGDVEFHTIPVVTADGRSPDGQSIVQIDPTAVRRYVESVVGRGQAPPPVNTGSNNPGPNTAGTGGGGAGVGGIPLAPSSPRLFFDVSASSDVPCVN